MHRQRKSVGNPVGHRVDRGMGRRRAQPVTGQVDQMHGGYLYVGSPVKQARPLSDKEKAFFTYSAANYVRLKDSYRQEA